jgi:hypothetical protein
MKIVPPKNDTSDQQLRRVAPLPLTIETNLKKTQKTLVFKLKVHPTDNNSPTYEFQMDALDGTETTREVVQWNINLNKVLVGFNITTATATDQMIQQTLRGKVLTTYNSGVNATRTRLHRVNILAAETTAREAANGATAAEVAAAVKAAVDKEALPALNDEMITNGIHKVIESLVPHKALQRQKRCMRRYWRKPKDMAVKQYVSNILHINEVEIPLLPPFITDQGLSEDELMDMVLFGCPPSWTKEMDKQGMNPENITLTDAVAFFERLEESEGFDASATSIKKHDIKKKKTEHNKLVSGDKHCLIHGPNSHPSNACNELKKILANMRGESSSSSKPAYKNKTWKRGDDKKVSFKSDKSKKELAAFIKDTIKEEMNSFHSKKRKADDSSVEEEEGEMNQMDIDLSKFNYADMDNLKIDSDDDEVSA